VSAEVRCSPIWRVWRGVVECGLCPIRRMLPRLMRWRGCARGSRSWRTLTRGCGRRPGTGMSWLRRSWPRGTRRSRRWPCRSRTWRGGWARTRPRHRSPLRRIARTRRSRRTGRCAARRAAGRGSSPARSRPRCGSLLTRMRPWPAGRPRAAAAAMTSRASRRWAPRRSGRSSRPRRPRRRRSPSTRSPRKAARSAGRSPWAWPRPG
jgi:hypothetical protein